MLMFEVNWESEIIKFDMFKESEAQIPFSIYNPKIFEEGSKASVKTLSKEIFISEKIPPLYE